MRDARCLKAPVKLSLGQPGREFSSGASYRPDGIDAYRVASELSSNLGGAQAPRMQSKRESHEEQQKKAMDTLSMEMEKQPVEPLGLHAAIREVEGTDGSDAALQAREVLRAAVGVQPEHAELVRRLDEHMVAIDAK